MTRCTIRCVSIVAYHSDTKAVLSSGWTTTTGRLLGPKAGNSIQCLSQEHNDAL